MANCKNNFLCTLNSTLIFISFAIVSISSGPPYLKCCITFLHSNVFAALNFRISECLMYWGCFGTCRENWGFTACAVKNNLLSGIHIDQNALDLNYHSYVVEATFNRKQMYVFSRLPLYSLKGRRKDVSSVAIL